ncbi:hypothetical protein BD626DRAFT_473855 [Schizophyllum amplum]|uniref:Uncharacterized protein n=1 Tax=Schizophyllum amplum TaxID=97359 RepID=A0A550CX79_9AGAR|nr:hypothetical protein BD626DRAFT_473855 [Auriculariopsis ampla]
MDVQQSAPTLPPFGDPAFAPALFSLIRDAAPLNAPVDPVLIQSILLCLVAGDKHLIFRTALEDVSATAKAALVTLSAIFGLTCHRLKLGSHRRAPSHDEHDAATAFLRSLFLPSSQRTGSRNDPVSTKRMSGRKKRRSSGSSSQRPSLYNHWRPSPRPPTPQSPLKNNVQLTPRISPNEISYGGDNESVDDPFASFGRSKGAPSETHPTVVRPVPHTYSDPPPQQASPTLDLPSALVITGLEAADDVVQRALQRVMTEKCVILEEATAFPGRRSSTPMGRSHHGEEGQTIHRFPHDFVVVYVCALEPCDRPPIHRALLDKFSMSVNLVLQPNTRQILKNLNTPSYLTPAFSSSPTSTPLSISCALPAQSWPNRLAAFPPTLLASMRRACARAALSPALEVYLADLFAATRHHPELDGMLLTVRCQAEAEHLARAGRVLGRDASGMELLHVEADAIVDDASGSLTIDYRGEAALVDPFRDMQDDEGSALDVSDADVARIFPRVVSHRLRVRAGPEDQILGSVAYGAVAKESAGEVAWRDGRSVKDVLVRILADV